MLNLIILLFILNLIKSQTSEKICDFNIVDSKKKSRRIPTELNVFTDFYINFYNKTMTFQVNYPVLSNGVYFALFQKLLQETITAREIGGFLKNNLLSVQNFSECLNPNGDFDFSSKCWQNRLRTSSFKNILGDLVEILDEGSCTIVLKYTQDISKRNFTLVENDLIPYELSYVQKNFYVAYYQRYLLSFYGKTINIRFREYIYNNYHIIQDSEYSNAFFKLLNLTDDTFLIGVNFNGSLYKEITFEESHPIYLSQKFQTYNYTNYNYTFFYLRYDNNLNFLNGNEELTFKMTEFGGASKDIKLKLIKLYESKGFSTTITGGHEHLKNFKLKDNYTKLNFNNKQYLRIHISLDVPGNLDCEYIRIVPSTLKISKVCYDDVFGCNTYQEVERDINCLFCHNLIAYKENGMNVNFSFNSPFQGDHDNYYFQYGFKILFLSKGFFFNQLKGEIQYNGNHFFVLNPFNKVFLHLPDYTVVIITIAVAFSSILFIGIIILSAGTYLRVKPSKEYLKKYNSYMKINDLNMQIPLNFGKYAKTKDGKFIHLIDLSYKYLHPKILIKNGEFERTFENIFKSLRCYKYSAYSHCKYCYLEQQEYNEIHHSKTFKNKLPRCCKCGLPTINYVTFVENEMFCVICSTMNKYDVANHGRCVLHLSKPNKSNGSIFHVYKDLFSKGSASKKKKPSLERNRLITIIKEENWKLNCAMRYEYLYLLRDLIGKELFIPFVTEETITCIKKTISKMKKRVSQIGSKMKFNYTKHSLKIDFKKIPKKTLNEFYDNTRLLLQEGINALQHHLYITEILQKEKKKQNLQLSKQKAMNPQQNKISKNPYISVEKKFVNTNQYFGTFESNNHNIIGIQQVKYSRNPKKRRENPNADKNYVKIEPPNKKMKINNDNYNNYSPVSNVSISSNYSNSSNSSNYSRYTNSPNFSNYSPNSSTSTSSSNSPNSSNSTDTSNSNGNDILDSKYDYIDFDIDFDDIEEFNFTYPKVFNPSNVKNDDVEDNDFFNFDDYFGDDFTLDYFDSNTNIF